MRRDELIASAFLKTLDIGSVKYEPDGNVTPDFLLDGRIGVEVRRLNLNYILPNGKVEGYETLGASAWRMMERVAKTFGPSIDGETWNIVMGFRRPIVWKTLEPVVVARLNEFKASSCREDITLRFGDNFELDLMRSRRDKGSFFCLMGGGNADAGGAVMALVEQNLRLCVEEKERKVAPHRHKHNEWWLLLINRVDIHMEAEDYEEFSKKLNPPLVHAFNRILIIDPRDNANWFEI